MRTTAADLTTTLRHDPDPQKIISELVGRTGSLFEPEAAAVKESIQHDRRWTPELLASVRDLCVSGSVTRHNQLYDPPEPWLECARAAQQKIGLAIAPPLPNQEAQSPSGASVVSELGGLASANVPFSMIGVYGRIESAKLSREELRYAVEVCRYGMLIANDPLTALCFRGVCVETMHLLSKDPEAREALTLPTPERGLTSSLGEASVRTDIERCQVSIELPHVTIYIGPEGTPEIKDTKDFADRCDVEGMLRRRQAAVNSGDTIRNQDYKDAVGSLRGDSSAYWCFGSITTSRMFITDASPAGIRISIMHNFMRDEDLYATSGSGKKEHESGIRSILQDLVRFNLADSSAIERLISQELKNLD